VKGGISLKLRFDEADITYWADLYMKKGCSELEIELMSFEPDVKERGYLTKNELVKVAKWKWPPGRPATLAQENSDDHIRDITSEALSTTNIDDSHTALWRNLSGVGPTIGSAILHLYHKDPYPIWDWRALESVGERKGGGVWRRYVEYCRELVARNNVNIQTLNRALWKYSKEKKRQ